MAGATNVGSIEGFLKLNDSDWNAKLDEAGAKADALKAHSPDIKINVDDAKALGQLAALNAAYNRLDEATIKRVNADKALDQAQRTEAAGSAKLEEATQRSTKARKDEEQAALGLLATTARIKQARDDEANATDKLAKSTNNAAKGFGPLVTAAIALGPAIIPLAAVGIGAMAGLGAAAGVALLAFKGVKAEIVTGTQVGKEYKAGLATLNNEFTTLQGIASAGVLKGFNAGIATASGLFPALNRDVGVFSSQLGTIAGNVLPGFVGLFHQLEPLFYTFGNLLVDGSAKFKAWATSSTSVSQFVAYAQTQLPNVVSTLGNLITTLGHIVVAAEPFGGVALTGVKLFSAAINAIPIGVLQALVPVIAGVAVGLKGLSAASNAAKGISGLADKLGAAGSIGEGVATKLGAVSKVVGFLGPLGVVAGAGLGLLSTFLNGNAASAQKAQQEVNSYTDALIKSNGAIDQNVTKLAEQNLQGAGAIAAASRLGISQEMLTRAALKQGNSLADVKAQLASFSTEVGHADLSMAGLGNATAKQSATNIQYKADIDTVTKALGDQNSEFAKSVKAAQEQKIAQDAVTVAAHGGLAAIDAQAKEMGVSRQAYIDAATAADAQANAVKHSTLEMQLAGDQAGLLKAALDSLAGKQLGAAEAATALAASENNAGTTIKANHAAFLGNSAAAVANQQAIQQVAEALRTQIDANEKAGMTTAQATGQARTQAKQFADNIIKTYGLTGATAQYIRKILDIPAVAPTKAEMDKAVASARLAEWRREIEQVPQRKLTTVEASTAVALASILAVDSALGAIPRYIYTTIVTQRSGIFTPQDASTNRGPGGVTSATGGHITGPGSETSDSIPAMLSNNEFVIKAAAVRKYGTRFFENLNAMKFADGGYVGSSGGSGGGCNHPVYVQNPFTGEYLLAQVDHRTSAKLSAVGHDLRMRVGTA